MFQLQVPTGQKFTHQQKNNYDKGKGIDDEDINFLKYIDRMYQEIPVERLTKNTDG